MKPYYEDDRTVIYNGDCREVLPEIARASVDVVLTDPPFFMPAAYYGIKGSHSGRPLASRSWGDTSVLASFWGQVVDLSIPTLRRTGHLLTFCNGESYPVFYPEVYRRFDSSSVLVWDKGRIGMGRPWRNQHELILAARWSGSFSNEHKGCSNVIKCSPVSQTARVHPVDKPVDLMAELMRPITPVGGTILDPFAGGGSVLVAARQSGFRAIGIETEERYCEAIASRLSQGDLFGDAA